MHLTGAEILIKTLIEEGVDTIFGYPGGAVLNIYDEIYKHKDNLDHVLVAHEQGAAHAADGYARSTGKVGVCISTSGPGATNLVTGIATAYMDSVPMVAITGNVISPLLGKDSFQEVNITDITKTITKKNYIVKDVNELQDIIKEAFYIAKEGRPGPVLVDIPKDITALKGEYEKKASLKVERKVDEVSTRSLEEVAKLINESKKPFIFAGGGIIASDANEELKELVNKINSPIATSLMGMCAISNEHDLYTGMIGMHGSNASNVLATECDLILTLGARFSDRVVNNQKDFKNAKLVHVDVDKKEINKNVVVDYSIVGDLKEVLQGLLPLVNEDKNQVWLDRMNELKKLKVDVMDEDEEGDLTPEFLFKKLNQLNDGSFIISTEVGQHQMWAAKYFNYINKRSFLSSGGLGTMGFGLGAAIGAQVGSKDKQVINIAGDGSFGMNCNEIVTAVKHNLPLIVVVMNNNALGMVRQWQNFFYEERYSHTTLNRPTDFVKLTESFGGSGFRVTRKEELEAVLRKAINHKGTVVIDYVIHSDKKVFPMVAPGAPIDNIIND